MNNTTTTPADKITLQLKNFKALDESNKALVFSHQENFRQLLLYHLKKAEDIYYEHQTTLREQPKLNEELRMRIDETIRRFGEIMFMSNSGAH
jgi:hypothetical protein